MPGGGNAQSFLLRQKFTNEVVLRKEVIGVSSFTGSKFSYCLAPGHGFAFNESLESKIIRIIIK